MPHTSQLRALESRVATLEEAVGLGSAGPDQLLPTSAVARRYGVTMRCIDRWAADPRLDFPQPETIKTRKYWRESLLRDWDRARLMQSISVA